MHAKRAVRIIAFRCTVIIWRKITLLGTARAQQTRYLRRLMLTMPCKQEQTLCRRDGQYCEMNVLMSFSLSMA